MKCFIFTFVLILCVAGLAFPQDSGRSDSYGAKGLAVTEKVLSKLDLPLWCWNGAHDFEKVKERYFLIEGELLDLYFTARPDSGLIDPQHILDPEQRKKIEKVISEHDMKSALPLCLCVLGNKQKLSLTAVELKLRLLKMFENQTSAIIIFYSYGFARGMKGYILLDEHGFIEDWEVDELFIKSSKDASIQVEEFAELETLMKDISKRSYWIEQKLMPPVIAKKSDFKDTKSSHAKSEWAKMLEPLAEYTMTFALAFVVSAAGALFYLWSNKWRKYVIPDADVPVRLGANYGATVCDTIEFSDPKISLIEQHYKLKETESAEF